MLLVNDATKLPVIYSRTADKSKFYLLGVTEKTDSVLQMSDHKVHAYHRKMIRPGSSKDSMKGGERES